ncbi:MAG: TRAP transporter large permease subunit [Spirochaetota bacterium]
MMLTIMLIILVALILLGVHIAFSLGASSLVYFLVERPALITMVPQRIWAGTDNFSIMIFGGISGSSVADTSAPGSILIPNMVKKGYSKGFSAGVTVASSMGMIIPPSVPLLIYAMISGASLGRLFLAGLVPGALIGFSQLVVVYILSRKHGYHPPLSKFNAREAISTIRNGMLAILVPLIIILTVSLGIATATESAAVAVLYAAILGLFVYKELTLRDIIISLKKTVMISSSFVIFIFLDILILFIGTFVDVTPSLLLLVPILLPVMRQFDINVIILILVTLIPAVSTWLPSIIQ